MKKTTPLVSIVICNYNGMDYVDDCLSAVFQQDYTNFEVIFVDNNSTDGSVDYVRENFPSVKVVQNEENYGDSKGNNIGIMHSEGEYIVILNPDAVVGADWLLQLVKAMEENKNAGACMSKLLFFDKRNSINSDGNELSFLGFGWSGNYNKKDREDKRIREVTYASTTSLILRRSTLEDVGLFDESFFLSQEDVDLGLRMRVAGYTTLCNPSSIVYHKYRFQGGERLRFSERDRLVCLLKTFQKKTLFLVLPAFIVVEIATVFYALSGDWLLEKLKTYLYLLKNLPSVLEKRYKIQQNRVINDNKILPLLRGGIYFKEVQNPALSHLLNPFLEGYFRLLKKALKVK